MAIVYLHFTFTHPKVKLEDWQLHCSFLVLSLRVKRFLVLRSLLSR